MAEAEIVVKEIEVTSMCKQSMVVLTLTIEEANFWDQL
jgi:hypothetical protein